MGLIQKFNTQGDINESFHLIWDEPPRTMETTATNGHEMSPNMVEFLTMGRDCEVKISVKWNIFSLTSEQAMS